MSGRHAGFDFIDRTTEKRPLNARFRRRFYEMRYILQGKVSDHAATCRKTSAGERPTPKASRRLIRWARQLKFTSPYQFADGKKPLWTRSMAAQ
ncbi:hypothetical protein F7R15_07335 [Pseudomonas reinekei]|uniref:Uncharacterized protein n=1 Tax=Pseudomonas reinekei TaxID=395598 RepID=A0A6H9REA4_PSERE|nr:hypothetical protein F7R15_07335 [Pseudomonas reinekei]